MNDSASAPRQVSDARIIALVVARFALITGRSSFGSYRFGQGSLSPGFYLSRPAQIRFRGVLVVLQQLVFS